METRRHYFLQSESSGLWWLLWATYFEVRYEPLLQNRIRKIIVCYDHDRLGTGTEFGRKGKLCCYQLSQYGVLG